MFNMSSSKARQVLSTTRGETTACVVEAVEFARSGYREFAELSLVFLTATKDKVSFRHTDALHKCCWMGKVLKLHWVRTVIEYLPTESITSHHWVTGVRKFVKLVTHFYLMCWISCNKVLMLHGMISNCSSGLFSTTWWTKISHCQQFGSLVCIYATL